MPPRARRRTSPKWLMAGPAVLRAGTARALSEGRWRHPRPRGGRSFPLLRKPGVIAQCVFCLAAGYKMSLPATWSSHHHPAYSGHPAQGPDTRRKFHTRCTHAQLQQSISELEFLLERCNRQKAEAETLMAPLAVVQRIINSPVVPTRTVADPQDKRERHHCNAAAVCGALKRFNRSDLSDEPGFQARCAETVVPVRTDKWLLAAMSGHSPQTARSLTMWFRQLQTWR